MPEIKICGLTRSEDIDYANEAKPDYIGFVFAESKRRVTFDKALLMKRRLDKSIKSVGVFVNESPEIICDIVSQGIIDIIQLHGDENEEYISCLRNITTTPIIKALRIKSELEAKNGDESSADIILFDTYSDKSYGGTGVSFDWDLIKNISRPYFLAGGMNKETITKAYKIIKPKCFDVSGAVETNGVKDRLKMIEIVNIVRSLR